MGKKKSRAADDQPGIYGALVPRPRKRAVDLPAWLAGWREHFSSVIDEAATNELVEDAQLGLEILDGLESRAFGPAENIPSVVHWAYHLGKHAERMWVNANYSDVVKAARRNSDVQGNRRKGKGVLTDAEWGKVEKFVDAQKNDKRSIVQACEMAASQIRTGKFRGVRHLPDLEAGTLRGRWYSTRV